MGTTNFTNNSAHYGGAINTSINNTLTFGGTITFTNNGYNQGEIETVNTDITYGGAVHIDHCHYFTKHNSVLGEQSCNIWRSCLDYRC